MEKVRFGMIGGGWRAEFYARIANSLPEQFELTAVQLRDGEKGARWEREFGGRVVYSFEDLMATGPDFVVLSITKTALTETLLGLMDKGVPILCETPPSIAMETLDAVWEAAQAHGADVQVAEQYGYQPYYMAWRRAVDEGWIGPVSNLLISTVHSYHAASLIRAFLGVGLENAKLVGSRHFFPVVRTDSRAGLVFSGEEISARRDRVEFVFDSGKAAFFDFSTVQYESYIRTRQFTLQGLRGEIDDRTIRYLTDENEPVSGTQTRLDQGVYGNRHWSHYGIAVNGRYLYKSPFPYGRLNDDEIAIGHCLLRMKQHVADRSVEVYSLQNALQDAYFALEMENALENPGKMVQTQTRIWRG